MYALLNKAYAETGDEFALEGLAENRWLISGPKIARVITEFEDDTALITEEKTDQANHHEEGQGIKISFAKDVNSISQCDGRDGKSILGENYRHTCPGHQDYSRMPPWVQLYVRLKLLVKINLIHISRNT